jgi:hypothetical protein
MHDDYDDFDDFDDFDNYDDFGDYEDIDDVDEYAVDDYLDSLEEYEEALDDLAFEQESLRDEYEMKLQEIDEYWDRENQYIMTSGIYSEEEVQTILQNHEQIRREKKDEAKLDYDAEKERLRFERDNLRFDREMDRKDWELARQTKEMERNEAAASSHQEQAVQPYISGWQPEKPGLLKRIFTFAGMYYLFKKLF